VPLLWTCKSTRNLAEALVGQGHRVSRQTVARLLQATGYNLQVNRKTREGASHPDRDAQFRYIAKQVRSFQRRGQPVVSVDTKKKELVGDFKNPGREWQPKGTPDEVRCKDFIDKTLGKVTPYGVYDQTVNEGWVSVGIDHDTARFATESLRRWWSKMGRGVYPRATDLLVTADGGGSNGSRSRLWKLALQGLADEVGLRITVCHFPPGTSKWNKIEHRMFCHITENWRGRPLISRSVVVNLIGNTRTKAGLKISAELDTNSYPTGLKVTDAEFATIKIKPSKFHGEWNYTISPG
jgi:Rhodopirellula transposase DDE domain